MAKGYTLLTDNGFVQNASNLIATVTGIDLKTTGQTTLYTVPAGKTLVITDIIIIPTTISVFATAAIVRVGKAAAYTEWCNLTTLTALNAITQFFSLAAAGVVAIRQVFVAADVVKMDVQTGAGATTFTATAQVWGYLY